MYYNKNVTSYIQKTRLPAKDLLIAIRMAIHSALPEVKENFAKDRPEFIYNKQLCFIKAFGNCVRMGFYNAEKLDDPQGLLRNGQGNYKYIEFSSLKELNEYMLNKWLLELTNRSKPYSLVNSLENSNN